MNDIKQLSPSFGKSKDEKNVKLNKSKTNIC